MDKRESILGTNISVLNMKSALATMDSWLSERSAHYVCVTPAHSIMDGYNDPEFQGILNSSGMTTPDGMAVVWLLKLKGHASVGRVYGPDLLLSVCDHGLKQGYRHFFYGGKPGVTEKLIAKLSARFPDLKIAGFLTPPFRDLSENEDNENIERINQTQADIIWVGLGSPKQEFWMHEHLGRINAPAIVGVGAAFDFLSGNKPQAPKWMQHNGLEWLFRFINEPGRLLPRYRQYPKFALLTLIELIRFKYSRVMENCERLCRS